MEGKSNMRRYKLYIFDLDGTLFTIPVDWREVRQELKDLGFNIMDNVPLFKQLVFYEDQRLFLEKIFETIDKYESKALDKSEPKENAIEMLNKIKGKIFLVTMQGMKFCSSLLNKFSISNVFSKVITREFSLQRVKQLSYCIEVSKEKDALFVGDKEDDALASIALGIDFAPVPNYKGKIMLSNELKSLLDLLN
ncbi:MAG: HAD-IA family hydrolase [Candidatus Bathyarchaeia archaeon]